MNGSLIGISNVRNGQVQVNIHTFRKRSVTSDDIMYKTKSSNASIFKYKNDAYLTTSKTHPWKINHDLQIDTEHVLYNFPCTTLNKVYHGDIYSIQPFDTYFNIHIMGELHESITMDRSETCKDFAIFNEFAAILVNGGDCSKIIMVHLPSLTTTEYIVPNTTFVRAHGMYQMDNGIISIYTSLTKNDTRVMQKFEFDESNYSMRIRELPVTIGHSSMIDYRGNIYTIDDYTFTKYNLISGQYKTRAFSHILDSNCAVSDDVMCITAHDDTRIYTHFIDIRTMGSILTESISGAQPMMSSVWVQAV